MRRSAGGGQKVNILARELAKYKNDNETILMFTDRYKHKAIHQSNT